MKIKEFNNRKAVFGDPKIKELEITKKNFHELENYKKELSQKKLMFIDGGNAEILRSASFSLSICRIAFIIFKNNKRIAEKKIDFYCFIKSCEKENKLVFTSDIIFINDHLNLDKKNLEFDIYDETLRQGSFQVSISEISNAARRFAEYMIIEKAINYLENGDIIIKDGILTNRITHEEDIYNKIKKLLTDKKIILAGLGKSCNLLTNKGESLTYFLLKLSEKENLKSWWYWPLCDSRKIGVDIYFAKLNEKSDYVFRLDVVNETDYNFSEIFDLLKQNSVDSAFLGYPYGLVYVDTLARISEKEKEYHKAKFMSINNSLLKEIIKMTKDNDAHNVLDNLRW